MPREKPIKMSQEEYELQQKSTRLLKYYFHALKYCSESKLNDRSSVDKVCYELSFWLKDHYERISTDSEAWEFGVLEDLFDELRAKAEERVRMLGIKEQVLSRLTDEERAALKVN
jgi:hypothetical protein